MLIRVYNFNGARRNGTTILADLINPRGSISCVVTSNAPLDAPLLKQRAATNNYDKSYGKFVVTLLSHSLFVISYKFSFLQAIIPL